MIILYIILWLLFSIPAIYFFLSYEYEVYDCITRLDLIGTVGLAICGPIFTLIIGFGWLVRKLNLEKCVWEKHNNGHTT